MEMRILDPKILILSCVIAVSLDSLFFYIPVIDGRRNCLGMDKKLAIITCVLRSFFDMFYLLRIISQFRTGFIAPSSGVFGRGELVEDPVAIAKRYLSSYFIIDILSLLPLPQVALLKGPNLVVMKESLMLIVFSQYVPRLIRIYPLYKEVTRTSGKVTESAWAGATSNFCLYMLACHVVGAIWYLLSIERKVRCWRDACWKLKCEDKYLYCGEQRAGDNAFLNASCPLIVPDEIKDLTVFNFGIFLDALQSGVVESRDFHLKFSYCFWWGLRSLSVFSLGQNLKTSTFIGEIYFAVFISAFGLVLFSLLIGNMQKYLRSATMSECMIRNPTNSSSMLPTSTRTVEALTEVEASQFRQLRSKQAQLASSLRSHTQHLETGAACFIQAAWRQYCGRKLKKSLREEEGRRQEALEAGTSSSRLGTTISINVCH